MNIGTRVTLTTFLGAVLLDGPHGRFAISVPPGTGGEVVEVPDGILPEGWFAVRPDAPYDVDAAGRPVVVPCTTAWCRP